MFEVLGFTSPISTAWNGLAYAAFVLIIIGVASDRYRNAFTTVGALALAVYAYVFLHNDVFAALQVLVCIWTASQWMRMPRDFILSMIFITVFVYTGLYLGGSLVDTWAWIGSFGLLMIMTGLMALPRRYAFLLMAGGGTLLVLYAYSGGAWVFFFLNFVYVGVSLYHWMMIVVLNIKVRQ